MPKFAMANHVARLHAVSTSAAIPRTSPPPPTGFTTILAATGCGPQGSPTTPAPRTALPGQSPVPATQPPRNLAPVSPEQVGPPSLTDHSPSGHAGVLRRPLAETAAGPAKATHPDLTGPLEPGAPAAAAPISKASPVVPSGLFGPAPAISASLERPSDGVRPTAPQTADTTTAGPGNFGAPAGPAPSSVKAEPHTSPQHQPSGPFDPATLSQVESGPASSPNTSNLAAPNQGSAAIGPPGTMQPAPGLTPPASPPPSNQAPSVAADPGTPPVAAMQVGQAAVALHLGSSGGVSGGGSQITIHLQPGALGAVQIRIERAHDGSTTVVLAVEKADTLHALQQDQQHLHQALDRAGLPVEARHVSFHLAEPSQDGGFGFQAGNGGQGAGHQGSPSRPRPTAAAPPGQPASAATEPSTAGWQAAGINITA